MAFRANHIALQKELHESYVKSKERLARLTSLEQEEQQQEQDDTFDDDDVESDNEGDEERYKEVGEVGNQSFNDEKVEGLVNENPSKKVVQEESDQDKEQVLSTPLVDMHSISNLEDFHRHRPAVGRKNCLGIFLPVLGRKVLEEIMTLSIREANALDSKKEGSPRRCLLWNSCLDFVLLTTNTGSQRQASKQSFSPGTTDASFDPNVSLCPYELSGVCADELCPYQHTSQRAAVPRERLPLPPLSLLEYKSVNVAAKRDHNHKAASKQQRDEKSEESSTIISTLQDPSGEEEVVVVLDDNFIALPTMHEEGEDQYDDAEDDSTGGDLAVSTFSREPTKVSERGRTPFWWEVNTIDYPLSSVTDILKGLGGIAIATSGDLQMTLFPTEGCMQSLGRIIDICRIAIHAGRFDITRSLLEVSSKVDVDVIHQNVYEKVIEQLARLEQAAFSYDAQSFSFFQTSFCVQASLVVLSEFVRTVENAKQNLGLEKWKQYVASLQDVAMDCTDAFMTSLLADEAPAASSDELVEEVLKIVLNTVDNKKKYGETENALFKFQDMENEIRWAQRSFNADSSPSLKSLHQIDDQILKSCWSLVSKSIHVSRNKSQEDRLWGCLNAIILMAYAILGSLERFAAEVNCGEDELSNPSLTAALTTVDATIHRILKGISNQLDDVPMVDLLLSPLLSASVTTSTFLRQYATSQHRLETTLSLSPDTPKGLSLTRFSEMLWSQLLHLRMCLPTESLPANTKTKYEWELSQEVKNDNKRLLDRLETLGIRLHRITLEGDWNLVCTMGHSRSRSKRRLPENLSHIILRSIFRANSQEEEENCSVQMGKVNLVHRSARGRNHFPSISTLPRSILLAGHSMKNLCLEECNLLCLPSSFGLYFPNLKVRTRRNIC